MKFKVGDRVIYSSNSPIFLVGREGHIRDLKSDGSCTVMFDFDPLADYDIDESHLLYAPSVGPTHLESGRMFGYKIKFTAPQCECGAHKVNSKMHSNWCQMKGVEG